MDFFRPPRIAGPTSQRSSKAGGFVATSGALCGFGLIVCADQCSETNCDAGVTDVPLSPLTSAMVLVPSQASFLRGRPRMGSCRSPSVCFVRWWFGKWPWRVRKGFGEGVRRRPAEGSGGGFGKGVFAFDEGVLGSTNPLRRTLW